MSDTKKTPTTSSHIPQAGDTLPGPPRPACNRERGSATPEHVIPPDPPLPRNRSARGRAKGPAEHAGPTAGPMTTGVLSSTAIRQIRVLALGERLQPAIRTETEAQAAHAALVQKIFSALRSVPVRRVGNPPRGLSRTRPQDLQQQRTAAHARRQSPPSHAQGRRRHEGCGITSSHWRTGRWTSQQRLQTGP